MFGASSSGGAIAASASSIQMDDCHFSGCHARARGGAVSLRRSVLTVNQSSWQGCTATDGDALALSDASSATMDNSYFNSPRGGVNSSIIPLDNRHFAGVGTPVLAPVARTPGGIWFDDYGNLRGLGNSMIQEPCAAEIRSAA